MYIHPSFPFSIPPFHSMFSPAIRVTHLDISLTEDHQRLRWAHNKTLTEHGSQHRYASMQTCLWNCFCFYTHNTVALKSLSGKITPKTNLTLLPEFDGRAGVPGDKASWLVEDWGWAIKAGTRATQSTLPAGPTSTVTVLYVDSVPSQKYCLDFFWT